ncbi:MAG: phytoene desaturase [Roseicyclus sp.]|nr:phytoene desaturase [Roseicyclus sp.]MBO6624219.1 phytoene desaturase [Roseicyclus sp.]MBO6920881.1 phytoene desaturase [Roseicyclus sp.]
MATPTDTAVVIGAGIAGLSAALRLSHAGLRVRVIDMHDAPGGKMRTLPSAAGPVDAGPTVLTMRPVFEELFAEVGERLEDHVSLHRETVLARHWWADGSSLDLFDDAERSAEAVRLFAGERAEAEFRAFSARAGRLYDGFDAPMMQSHAPGLLELSAHVLRHPGLIRDMAPLKTLAGSLAAQFSDPRLRQLFGRYATYVGGSPYRSPAILGLIWRSEANGVWRVEGGMHRLAQALHDLGAKFGAEFNFAERATRIEQQDGRVSAVHLQSGERLVCNLVVFNGDPKALYEGRLGPGVAHAVEKKAVRPRSLSAYVWAFAAQAKGCDLSHHNVFFGTDPKSEFDDLAAGRMPHDPTLYLCAQDRGDRIPPKSPERFEIIMNGPAGRIPDAEEAQICQTRTFETFQRLGLTFSPRPETTALTTPAEFGRLFPGSDGSLYGRSPHGMMAAFHRPKVRSRVPGLYLAGGGVHPGAGVPMACLSGRHAAAAILSDRASTSTSRRTAMPGGMSTGSATMAKRRSPSSAS